MKCIGYKGSGLVHFQFIATNKDQFFSSAKYYLENTTISDDLGNSYATDYNGNVDLPFDIPVVIKY